MKNKVLLISLAVVLAISLGIVGCTGGTVTPGQPQGTVVIARASLAKETFLPWTGGAIEKNYLSGTIYESLTLRDRNANVLPCLATKWEMSADGKTWTVTIRQGIPFHDAAGNTYGNVTAADVKYTFERLASNGNNTAPKYPASVSHIAGGLQGDFGPKVSDAIEAVGNDKVIFHLAVADIAFMKTYTGPDMMGVVSKSYLESAGDALAADKPVGTGPYVKDSVLVGAYIQMRAVDDWANHWRMSELVAKGENPLQYYQYIKFVIVPDVSTRALGLINGDYQMAEVAPEVVAQVVDDPNCTVLPDITAILATDVIRLGGLNQLDAYAHVPADPVARYDATRPWANPTVVGTKTAGQLVRQALNLAIDRQAMVDSIYEGVGTPAAASMSIPEWVTTLTPYGYDPAQAKTLLDQAGYPGTGGQHRFSITLLADERYSDKLVALAVQSYWQAVGIDVTVQDVLWGSLRPTWQKGGSTEGNLATGPTNYAWCHRTPPSTGDPALAINMAFDPKATIGDYTEATEDALRLAMLNEINPTQRTANLKIFGAYVHDQATQVFLVSVYGPIGVRKTLAEPRNVFDLKENPELIHRA